MSVGEDDAIGESGLVLMTESRPRDFAAAGRMVKRVRFGPSEAPAPGLGG
jgi:hypothetical protein